MILRWLLALTLLLPAAGCDRAPRPEATRPWFDAIADGAFLPRDPWLDFVELHREVAAEGGGWRVPFARWLEVEDGWGGSEHWGGWGLGGRTRFRCLLHQPGPYDFFIVAMGPPGAGDRPQEVAVRWNGEAAGSFTAGPDWEEHRIRIPEGLLDRGWNRLELVYGYHLDGALENDDRQLALAIERLGLIPPDRAPPRSGGSPGFRLYRGQDLLVLEASGTYVVPLDVPANALSLDLTVGASGTGSRRTLGVGLMTIGGEQRNLARLTQEESLSVPLADHQGSQLLLTLEADLAPGTRFTIRDPAMTLGGDEAPAPETAPAAASERPHIVLIVLDAARADHFGVYGYDRDTTPAIDRLAAEALVFDNAVAECSYTLCSMPSLLTGLSFVQHGMVEKELILREEVTTVAETLREAGYLTVGFTGNPNNSSVTGTDQGFEEFHEIWKAHPRFITRRVLRRLKALGVRQRPLFLMLHYVPPHEPYAPDPDFDVFGDPGYGGPVTSDREFTRAVYAMDVTLDGDDLAEMVSLYDGNLRMGDASVGRVLAYLRKAGVYDDALVIVTSDHGEAFLEHGRVGHNSTVYGEMVRVPLIVKLPAAWKERAEGVDLGRLVTLADVPATIFDLLGIEPSAEMRSTSLLARGAPDRERLIYLRSAQIGTPVLGVRTPRFKALSQAGGPPEIYDVLRDPEERENLIVENPVLHAGLSRILAREIREPGELRAGVREGEIADKDKAMLRALGYL